MPYSDAGVYASDAQTPDSIVVSTTGLRSLRAALNATDVAQLGKSAGNQLYGPWLLRYIATDAAGNAAPAVTRSVYIDVSCPSGEFRCPASGLCSVSTLCVQGLPAALTPAPPATPPAPYTPPVDTTPPTLTLALLPGDRVGSQPLPGTERTMAVVQTTLRAGATYVDPGVTAVDDTDGDISALVSKLGLRALDTSVPTVSQPQLLEYRVTDAAGNLAAALRAITFACAPGESICDRAGAAGAPFCSKGGVCVRFASASASAQAPRGVVSMALQGAAVAFIEAGTSYAKCQTPRPLDQACDAVRFCYCLRCWTCVSLHQLVYQQVRAHRGRCTLCN